MFILYFCLKVRECELDNRILSSSVMYNFPSGSSSTESIDKNTQDFICLLPFQIRNYQSNSFFHFVNKGFSLTHLFSFSSAFPSLGADILLMVYQSGYPAGK